MKQKGFCCLAICILSVAISMQGKANPVAYAFTDLGTLPGGISSVAHDINERGQVVGYSSTTGSPGHAFLYDGTMHDLCTLPGGSSSNAWGINESGQVVGWDRTSNVEDYAFLHDGAMHDLDALGGSESQAFGINDSGQIVGCASTSSGTHAFMYDGTMHDLGTLYGEGNSGANDINNNGQVVGYSSTTDGVSHAFLYDGTMHDLGTLSDGYGSCANGINNNGKTVGYSYRPSGSSTAFLYDGTMHALRPSPVAYRMIEAYGINDCDQVVGTATTYVGDGYSFAWVWQNGTAIDLNDVVDLDDDWSYLDSAYAINNAGQIVGYGFLKNGQTRAFLLTPVPEPSSLLALVAGLGGLGILYRRRK